MEAAGAGCPHGASSLGHLLGHSRGAVSQRQVGQSVGSALSTGRPPAYSLLRCAPQGTALGPLVAGHAHLTPPSQVGVASPGQRRRRRLQRTVLPSRVAQCSAVQWSLLGLPDPPALAAAGAEPTMRGSEALCRAKAVRYYDDYKNTASNSLWG